MPLWPILCEHKNLYDSFSFYFFINKDLLLPHIYTIRKRYCIVPCTYNSVKSMCMHTSSRKRYDMYLCYNHAWYSLNTQHVHILIMCLSYTREKTVYSKVISITVPIKDYWKTNRKIKLISPDFWDILYC